MSRNVGSDWASSELPTRQADHVLGAQGRLGQKELARRWGLSTRTLERWRMQGRGPAFMKLGGRVVYRAEDVESYETGNLHRSTAAPVAARKR